MKIPVFLNSAYLASLKRRALRAGVWFKALPRLDRVLFDLTVKVARSVRSSALADRILAVVDRLERYLESKLSRALREVGFPLAEKLSAIALRLGHSIAAEWASDVLFAKFLAVMHLNDPKAYTV
ncbi:MAG: hypothetical protein QXV09_06755 [Candidatus Bathyarchaeia archaeon]